jgi:hypothetical protein
MLYPLVIVQLCALMTAMACVSSCGSCWLIISSAVSKSSTMAARIGDAAASLNLASNIAFSLDPYAGRACGAPLTLEPLPAQRA